MVVNITREMAFALGIRDRIQAYEADDRNMTIERFNGRKSLEAEYWEGWNEADHYCDNCGKWARNAAYRMRQYLPLH